MARKTEHFDYHVGLGAGVYANSSLGTSGQVLKSDGTNVYWGNDSSSGGDAATLDGYDSTAFALLAAENVFTLKQTVNLNTSAAASPGTTGVTLHLSGSDGISTRLWLDSYGVGTNYTARRANGTNATKTALLAADLIMNNSAFGHDGTAYSTGSRGGFQIAASQNWAVGAHGTKIILLTTADGSTTLTSRWIVENDGSLIYSGGTATGVSTVNAVDYFDNGVNINTIYASLAATNTFTGNLIVNKSGVAVPTAFGSDEIRIVSATGNDALFWADSFGGPPVFGGRRAAGVPGTPTAVQSGNTLVALRGYGYGTSAYSTSHRGSVSVIASENWSDTAQGTRVILATTPNLGAAQSARWIVENDGSLIYSGGSLTGNGTVNANDYFDNGININTIYLASASYTAADVLSKLLTVDGAGSGLDADLLDGLNSTAFGQLSAANVWTTNNTFSRAGVGDTLLTLTAAFPTSGSRSMAVTNPTSDSASEPFNVNTGNSLQFNIDSVARYLLNYSGDSLFTPANFLKSTITSAGATTSPLWATNESSTASTTVQIALQPSTSTSRIALLRASNSGADAITFSILVSNAGTADTAFTINPGLTFAFAGASGTIAGNTIWHAGNDGAGSGLDADLLDGYNIGTSGTAVPLLDGNNTYSGTSAFTSAVTISRGAVPLQITTTVDNANVEGFILEGDRATPAANDIVYMNWRLSNSAGTQTEFGRQSIVASTVTAASEASYWMWAVRSAGTLTNVMRLSSAAITPQTTDGLALGSTSLMWSDIFLASGAVVNFNNGDVTVTHSTNTLAFAGASSGYTFDAAVSATGLNLNSATSFLPQAIITNTNNDANAGYLIFYKTPADTTVTANDYLGTILWYGHGSASASGTAATVYARAEGTRGTNWVASNLFLGSVSTAGVYRLLALNADGTITWNSGAVWHVGNDGSGSGLDADLLDGNNIGTSGTAVPLLSGTNTWAGNQTFQNSTTVYTKVETTATSGQTGLQIITRNGAAVAQNSYIYVASANDPAIQAASGSFGTIWFAGNDGAGSGLDADLLDGNSSAYFLAAASYTAADVLSKLLTVDGAGSGLDADLWDGNNFATYLNQAVLTSSAPTFAGATLTAGLAVTSTAPSLVLLENDQGTDLKRWDFLATAGTLLFRMVNDDNSLATNLATITRTSTYTTATWNFSSAVTLQYNSNTIWHAGNDGSGSGLDADLLDGNNIGTSGAAVPLLNTNNTYSGISAFTGQVTMSRGAVPLQITTTVDNANVEGFILEGDRATPTANDIVYMNWRLSNSAGTQTEFGRQSIVASTVTAASEASYWMWSVRNAGTLTSVMQLTGTALSPQTNDGIALGTTALMWSDLFLASGGVVDFNNGDVTITHSADTLAFAGAATGYTFDGPMTLSSTAAGNPLVITSTEAGATAFTVDLFRNSASPAAADGLAALRFRGRNSTPATITYSSIQSNIADATAASEDANLYLQTMMAGTLTNALTLAFNGTQHRFTAPSDIIVSSVGANGYGAFYAIGSGTNSAYLFMGNGTNGERSRIAAVDSRSMLFSNDGGVTSHFGISSAGVLTASGNTVWHAGNDGAGSGLDADLLDGISSAAFAQLSVSNVFTLLQTINTNTSTAASPGTTGVLLHLSGADAVSTRLWLDSYGAATNYTARRANGTNASKTALLAGDVVMNNSAFGYDGTAYSTSSRGSFQITASQNWAVGAHGTKITFATTADNTTTQTTRWLVENDGSLIYSGGALTGVSTINAVDYFDNGVNINTIYLASASYTAADVLSKLLTVDGAGSGLDADLLDGISSTGFMILANQAQRLSTTAGIDVSGGTAPSASTNSALEVFQATAGADAYITFHIGSDYAVHFGLDGGTNDLFVGGWSMGTSTANKIWHAGNDGAGSGLDADLWDGNNFATYLNQALLTSSNPTFANITSTGTNGLQVEGVAPIINMYETDAAVDKKRWRFVANNDVLSLTGVNDAYSAETGIFSISRTSYTAFTFVFSSATTITRNGSTLWDAGNDGAGSGLDADLLDGYTIGTSGANIPILSGINTWSNLQTMSSLTARVTLTTAVSGTLTSAHANISVELNGNVTLNNSVFTAGDKTVFDPGTAARTFTRGAGVTMYVNGTDSATATLAANQIGGMHWRSASVVILTGAFS